MMVIMMVGCSSNTQPTATQPVNDFDLAITLVQDSMSTVPSSNISTFEYDAGKLKGGIAVLVDGDGAYWVKDGVVYAGNGTAKTWSPDVDYAPIGIDFDTIQDSIK